MRRAGWFWVVATLLFFQASDVTLRVASVETHFAVGTLLQAVPLMAVAVVAAMRGRMAAAGGRIDADRPVLPKSSWPLVLLYGGLQFFAGNVLFYASMQLGGLGIASPAVQSQAIWAVLIGGLLLRERISRVMIAGAVLFAAGIAGLAAFKSLGADAPSGDWLLAAGLGVLGGLAWASASAAQRVLLQRGVPVSTILAGGSLFGGAALTAFAGTYFGFGVWQSLEPAGAGITLLAGCFNGLAIFSISQAVRTIEISKVIPVISLNIVFNTITGTVFFSEYVNAGSIAGMLVAFAAVVLVQEPKFGRAKRSKIDIMEEQT